MVDTIAIWVLLVILVGLFAYGYLSNLRDRGTARQRGHVLVEYDKMKRKYQTEQTD